MLHRGMENAGNINGNASTRKSSVPRSNNLQEHSALLPSAFHQAQQSID